MLKQQIFAAAVVLPAVLASAGAAWAQMTPGQQRAQQQFNGMVQQEQQRFNQNALTNQQARQFQQDQAQRGQLNQLDAQRLRLNNDQLEQNLSTPVPYGGTLPNYGGSSNYYPSPYSGTQTLGGTYATPSVTAPGYNYQPGGGRSPSSGCTAYAPVYNQQGQLLSSVCLR